MVDLNDKSLGDWARTNKSPVPKTGGLPLSYT